MGLARSHLFPGMIPETQFYFSKPGTICDHFKLGLAEGRQPRVFGVYPRNWQKSLSTARTVARRVSRSGTAVEFHECCLMTGATAGAYYASVRCEVRNRSSIHREKLKVTLIGELMRSASGELTLQPLSEEQAKSAWGLRCLPLLF